MQCFFTALLLPFHKFNIIEGKKQKQKHSVISHIVRNSLKLPNETQKFIQWTCKNIETLKGFMTEFEEDNGVFETDLARKAALAWFLREAGARWPCI